MLRTLRAKLIGISVAITVCSLIAMTGTLFFVVRSTTLDEVNSRITQLTQASADQISTWAMNKRQITGSLKAVVGNPDPIPFLKRIEEAGSFDMAFYVQADKTPVFTKPRNPGYDGTARAWFKQAVAADAPAITPAYADTRSGKLTISFVEPTKGPDGKLLAVVGSDVLLTGVTDQVINIRPIENSFAFMVEGGGKILAYSKPELALKPVTDIAADITPALLNELAERQGHADIMIDGVSKILYASPVKGTPWTLAVVADRATVMAPIWNVLKIAAGIALVCVIVSVLLLTTSVRHQLRRLTLIEGALQDIASGEGDMTRRLNATGSDELANIARAFNQFVDKISAVLVRIRESSQSVHQATNEIASGNHDLSARTEQQAGSLEETSAAMEQMTATVQQNAENARQANQLANQASQVATRGGEVVSQVVKTMGGIETSARKIEDIIGVIDSIAFQTNILALNAAVEAARAGEQGRGFAVVASEVRTLAQRSATAAKEIKALIDDSVSQVTTGSRLVNEAGSTMEQVVDSVRRVTAIVAEISTASQEQSTGIAEVGQAISLMDQSTQQNAALVEQAAASAQQLQQQAAYLSDAVAGFKLHAQERAVAAGHSLALN